MGKMYLQHREIFILNGKYSWAKRKLVLHLYLVQIVYAYEFPEGNRKSIHMAIGSLYPLHVYEFMVVWTAISSYWSIWWSKVLKAFLFHLIHR